MAGTDVWSFYELANDTDRARFSDVERAVLAICDLRQEVNSGGFDSYLRYWVVTPARMPWPRCPMCSGGIGPGFSDEPCG
jgi:hypothetical protein